MVLSRVQNKQKMRQQYRKGPDAGSVYVPQNAVLSLSNHTIVFTNAIASVASSLVTARSNSPLP